MARRLDKLSDIQIRKLISIGEPFAVADGGGLTLTRSKAGTSTWILRYRHAGRPRELTIGRYPDKSLAKARDDARKARDGIQSGVDVARQKQVEKIRLAAQKTFRELATDYQEKVYPKLAATTVKHRTGHFNNWIYPKIGHIRADEVTTADVVSLIEQVGKKSIHVAGLVLTAVSETFKHGIARHVVTANPCMSISINAICGRPAETRTRLMLTEQELREILRELDFIGRENALAVKVLLATCVRIGELARAKWEDVNLQKSEWWIPDANSKSGKGFTVPLVPLVVRWFKQLQKLACGSPFVLPARQIRREHTHGGETYFEQRALNSMLHKFCDHLDKLRKPVRRFTPHDLRSTARSWLTSEAIGASVVVAERCLNHTLGGLLAVYDQHDYISERRIALGRWAKLIHNCSTSSN